MQTTILSEGTQRRVQTAELEIRNGALKGTVFRLHRDESRWLVGGREETADLQINDDTVSGEHFRMQMRGDAVVLVPLATTNGTFIGAVHGAARLAPQSEVFLSNEAVFYVGRVRLRLKWVDQEDVPISNEASLGGRLLGVSDLMRSLYSQIVRAARTDVHVLITGELGTGKDETAKLIHELSQRANGRFVKMDCMEMAIEERLADRMIFGKGKNAGLIESAAGGILYVDGVEDLPAGLQRRFASFLQHGFLQRTGESQKRPIDTRIIFSSRRDLRRALQDDALRPELYHRLSVILSLPPLRQRLVDISVLAPHFLRLVSEDLGKDFELTPNGIAYLETLPWKGNVLELQQFIRSAAIMGEECVLSAESFTRLTRRRSEIEQFEQQAGLLLEQTVSSRLSSNDAKHLLGEKFTEMCLRIVIRKVGRNTSEIAKILGVTDRAVRNQLAAATAEGQFEIA